MSILLLLILAHLLADFVLQTNRQVRERNDISSSIRHKALLQHAIIHFILSSLFILSWLWIDNRIEHPSIWMTLLVIVLVSLSHYVIDWAKYHIKQLVHSQKLKSLIFIGDQLLHIAVIFIAVPFITDVELTIQFSTFDKLIGLAILIILNTSVASYFMNIILSKLTPPNSMTQITEEEVEVKETDKEKSSQRIKTKSTTSYPDNTDQTGRYIGMLERLLIMILVFSNSFMGITIVLAIKSITRFKQFEDKRFSEYYLIGTLLSIIIAVTIGYAAKLLINS
ncbi:hypothetical protein CEY16_03150 [Halalkalibacillus sediminis]|uniref:DUF3307 domain-containing protein n=1 Tax=Halalkalibacillus sediminis TaxID=2018042 RepID=A0A2I0QWS5_9BACI|nr:DUF3307 domain-containing protein [Halalkalibacillus sediminis]PKR78768.1 hypothetical protein CEY16_03150 [Halalkalibacillus sediminis]